MSMAAARGRVMVLIGVCCAATVSAESLDKTLLYAPQGAVAGVVGSTLANAEQAYCRSVLNYSQIKGVFGEEVMERVALGSQRAGKWQAIPFLLGRKASMVSMYEWIGVAIPALC